MSCFRSSIIIALLPLAAFSMWWRIIPLDEAVKDSDVIIVGTLRNIKEETRDGIDYGTGELTVDEVIWGEVALGQNLSLDWENESGVICPRLEHQDHQGKKLLWLLKLKPGVKVTADNPGRFISVEKKPMVIELLREQGKSNKSINRTRS